MMPTDDNDLTRLYEDIEAGHILPELQVGKLTLLGGIWNTQRQLQLMIDAVVATQEFMPMPRAGWEQFVRDIEYTNEKRGLNLIVPRIGRGQDDDRR